MNNDTWGISFQENCICHTWAMSVGHEELNNTTWVLYNVKHTTNKHVGTYTYITVIPVTYCVITWVCGGVVRQLDLNTRLYSHPLERDTQITWLLCTTTYNAFWNICPGTYEWNILHTSLVNGKITHCNKLRKDKVKWQEYIKLVYEYLYTSKRSSLHAIQLT